MDYRVIFRNTATKECFVYTLTDTSAGGTYYTFLAPSGLTRGEYEYYITSADGTFTLNENDPRKSTIDGITIAVYDCGVAQVGAILRSDTSYNTTKTYEQYEG